MTFSRSLPSLKNFFALRYSPWMLIGLALILILAIAALAVRNAQRERSHMAQNLMDRAEALIWAVEAGTRASLGTRSGVQNLQALLEETAKQPGVLYMAVTDERGNRIASSLKGDVGTPLYTMQILKDMNIAERSQWRSITLPEGKNAFEVFILLPIIPSDINLHKNMMGEIEPI